MAGFGNFSFGGGAYGFGPSDTVVIPEATIALRATTGGLVVNPLTSNREQRFTFQLLDKNNKPLGQLDGVVGGSLDWAANAQIKGGGKVSVLDHGRDIDWLNVRIKPTLHVDGVPSWPLGVYITAAPSEDWSDEGRMWDVELLDRCSVLAEDRVDKTYSLPGGTVITTAVRDLIESSGENPGSITQASDTLSDAMVWDAGTSKLTIINDLLQAGGFWGLWADGNGAFRVEKHVEAGKRRISYEMLDDSGSIYTPDFNIDNDIYDIPNKVIAIGRGSGESEALVGVAENHNPKSPYSYERRGRWIVDVQTGIEATSQENLDNYAQRRLSQLTSPSRSIAVVHAPMPDWTVNDAIRFRNEIANVDRRFTISKTSINFDPTALAKSTLVEVADL